MSKKWKWSKLTDEDLLEMHKEIVKQKLEPTVWVIKPEIEQNKKIRAEKNA